MKKIRFALWIGLATLMSGGAALAQIAGEPADLPVIGVPVPGGVNYQPAVTPVAHDMHWLSGMLHWTMAFIVLFVMALLAIVVIKFNRKANPNPESFTHNTKVEIAWTLVPVLILIVIGSFSLPILFRQVEVPEPDLTIKATGNQWYWNYTYPENEVSFDSLMLAKEDLEAYGYAPDHYLLATDTAVVVPVNAVVRLLTTGADVIHAWAMPSFGVKMDAIPGRLNETWFQAEREGIYFGQCSELCGKDHSYMPITVKVVSAEQYQTWLDWAIEEYGGTRPEAVPATADAPAGAATAGEAPAAVAPAEPPSEITAPNQEPAVPQVSPSEEGLTDEEPAQPNP